MSENGENGPNPEALRKMFGELKSMARECRRSVRSRKNRVNVAPPPLKTPRQYCDTCGILFDVAATSEPKPPQKSRCGDCKNMLASGFVAFITKKHHAFVRPGPTSGLKPGGVYALTDEQMKAVQKRFQDQNGKDTHPEA